MFIIPPKVIRPIELMILNETGYTIPESIILDSRGFPYINTNHPFLPEINPPKNVILGIEKTGKGYGQYELDLTFLNGSFMTTHTPLYDISDGTLNLNFCPLGYTGSKRQFIEEYFGKDVSHLYEKMKKAQNGLEEKVVRSLRLPNRQRYLKYNVTLDIDTNPEEYPKTHTEREKLKRDLDIGNYTKLIHYAEYFEEMGEPLTNKQLETIIIIEDSERRRTSD